MSNQGLPSAHAQSGTRHVADKSYFIDILRTKINEIMEEIKRLEAENDQGKRGQSIQVNFAE
jgi:intraflagellar transport protein 74